MSLKDLVEEIAKALVDDPEKVEVHEFGGERTVVLELRVAEDDISKVIGKGGRTAGAIRIILRASAAKLRKQATLEILE